MGAAIQCREPHRSREAVLTSVTGETVPVTPLSTSAWNLPEQIATLLYDVSVQCSTCRSGPAARRRGYTRQGTFPNTAACCGALCCSKCHLYYEQLHVLLKLLKMSLRPHTAAPGEIHNRGPCVGTFRLGSIQQVSHCSAVMVNRSSGAAQQAGQGQQLGLLLQRMQQAMQASCRPMLRHR